MRVSLIITTYNWREALAVVIASAFGQTRLPDEIIVADDGSSDGTGEMVHNIARQASVPLHHSWQEDKGFRAAGSRNRAIAAATGDYVILIDGDVLLERHFVEDHLVAARPGFFVQGGRVLLDELKTKAILSGRKIEISPFDRGLGNRKNCFRLPGLLEIFSRQSSGIDGIRTCNFGLWRHDAVTVNGFNEDFEDWGREDSEFAVRLMHSGVKRRNLRFGAVAFHLHHPVQSRTGIERNDLLLEAAIRAKISRCDNGIDKYLVQAAEKGNPGFCS
jgi:glycosyltransferase involved in cell wall biosynthesis